MQKNGTEVVGAVLERLLERNVFFLMSDIIDHVIDERGGEVDDEGDEDEAYTVNQEEDGVRHERIYAREHGERAAVIGADVEHIEDVRLTVRPEHLLYHLVEQAGDREQTEEGEHAADEIAEIVLVPLVRDEEDAEGDL